MNDDSLDSWRREAQASQRRADARRARKAREHPWRTAGWWLVLIVGFGLALLVLIAAITRYHV